MIDTKRHFKIDDSSDAAVPDSVVFFDGVCNLCNGFVNFLIDRDTKSKLKFGALQGRTAQEFLDAEYRELRSVDSVVFFKDGKAWTRSTAALKILQELGGVYRVLGVLIIIPRPVRDLVYDFIARNRYSWFGRRDSCRLPTPEVRSRFVDGLA